MRYLLLVFILILVNCASPGGIGVLFNRKGIVKYVFANSPAQKAGIILEDLLLNPKDLRGPIGSMCIVKWKRGSTIYEQDIVRADVSTFRRPEYETFDAK